MPPKTTDYTLLVPAQTAELVDFGGSTLHFPIFTRLSSGKIYLQCDKCQGFFLLSASRIPTNLAAHRGGDACARAAERLKQQQLRSLTTSEAGLALSIFNHRNAEEAAGSASFMRARSELTTLSISTPMSSIPTTPTTSNPHPMSFSTHVFDQNALVDDTVADNFSSNFHISTGDLPRSSPPSESDFFDDDEGLEYELPPLEELLNSDEEFEDDIFGSQDYCKGERVEWTPGSVWDTFPYQQHADNTIGWKPFLLDNDKWIQLRSNTCKKYLKTRKERELQACINCLKIPNSTSFRKCVQRAKGDTAAHTPWKFLTPQQMRRLLVSLRKQNDAMKLKNLTFSRRIGYLTNKVNDFQRIAILLSQNKIAGVSRLLSVALRKGASPGAICDRLQSAVAGTYSPQGGWTDREFDVAFLIKALGGPRLLFVLQKEEGYPSLTTLRRRKVIPEIIISTGMPATAEFDANIKAFLGATGRRPPLRPQIGQVFMMDGVALEEACRFDLERNCILGLCREHSDKTKLTVDTIEDVQRVREGLFTDKALHHGKDGTVVAIASITGRDNYFPVPLVLSGSCKTEKGRDMAKWIPIFLECYRVHPDGEKRHGPIYTLATDGESSFRNLRFQIGLTKLLEPDSAIGKIIYQLPGMNRRTGAYGLLTTCDPKHIIKRFATMIRSPSGIQIGQVHITMETIRDALLKLDNMPPEKVHQLLHPADKQNVPKAVNLLQCLCDLTKIEHILNPTLHNRFRQVIFLSKALGYFLFPFIDVTMSLSDQIYNLSAYAHIMTAMYRRHRTAFLTSALYADSQAIVKNIFFTIARLQGMDRSLEYFILFEGTDRIEGIFSHVRTQDHARNFDILQLAQKLSIGAEINAVFQRHPDLDRGHVRRNLVNVRGVDHVNPASWKGDPFVGHVDIVKEYFRGREEANRLLVEYFSEEARVNFDLLFIPVRGKAKIDHLRPFGRYIGSSIDIDEDDLPVPLADEDINADDDDSESLNFEGEVLHSAPGDEVQALDLRDALDEPATEIETGTLLDIGPNDALNPLPKAKAHHLEVDGKEEYKPTLITRLLSSELGKKVTTRPLRARGIAVSEALQSRLESLNQSLEGEGDDLVKAGDLGAFFVRIGNSLCFAAAEIMSFQKGSSKIPLSVVKFDDLDANGTEALSVTVQILELKPKGSVPNLSWIWPSTRQFIRVQGKPSGSLLQRDFVLQIPGTIFHPLGPSVVEDEGCLTWSIQDRDLRAVFEHAKSLTHIESNQVQTVANIQNLPIVIANSGLPYQLVGSTPEFCLSLENVILPESGKKGSDDIVACRICEKGIPLKDMRNHVGQHILLSLRNCEARSARFEIGVNPCGWCGLEGRCTTRLTETPSMISVTSDCEYHYAKMVYKRAIVPSNRSPSTNVPLNCPLCSPGGGTYTFWKYNLLYHMTVHHLREDGQFPPFPRQLLVRSHISKLEELALGVTEEQTTEWRDDVGWPGSDAINVMDMGEDFELSRKRAGSSTSQASTRSRQPSPSKKSHGNS